MKIFFILLAMIATSIGILIAINSPGKLDDLIVANIDALAQDEGSIYDVKDYIMEYKIYTETATVSAGLDVTLLGKKVAVGGLTANVTYTFVFQQSTCTKPAPNNLCPYKDNGKITIISFR